MAIEPLLLYIEQRVKFPSSSLEITVSILAALIVIQPILIQCFQKEEGVGVCNWFKVSGSIWLATTFGLDFIIVPIVRHLFKLII